MHTSIDTLQANLTEIFHVVKNPAPASLPLVANYSGTRIYDARYSLGRFWTWIYRLGTFFTGYDYRLDKLKKAVLHTNNLFIALKATSDMAFSVYADTIKKAGKGYTYEQGSYLASRNTISRWNEATRPFIKILESHLSARLKRLLNYALGEIPASLRFVDNKSVAFGHCQKIIDVEGVFESPLPYSLLNKIMKRKPLSAAETKDIGKWIRQIKNAELSPNKLHQALTALASFYIKDANAEDVGRLELALEEQGLHAFSEGDPKHIAWRDNLKEDSKIIINGNIHVLGRELFPDEQGSDDTRVYTLKTLPDKVALIAKNKIVLNLRQLKMLQNTCMGIHAAKIDEISADGSAAIMEKLMPLDAIGNILADNPHNKMNSTLAALIGTMVKEQQTPEGFTPSTFMMDHTGRLHTLRPLITGAFDFNCLEDFALKCSGGNKELFKVLMTESGLNGCHAARFYNDYLKMHLEGNAIELAVIAGIYKISDPKVVDRCASLIKEINAIKSFVHARLRIHFPNENSAKLNKRINQAILECKLASGTAGKLWPSFSEDILTQCTKGSLPS